MAKNAYGLKSNGFQASLNLAVLSSKKYNWDFTVNFSNQTSKISKVVFVKSVSI